MPEEITVAGGVYYERCLTPPVEALLGSGGRAAAALASIANVTLHTFFPEDVADDVILNMVGLGVKPIVHPSTAVVEFFYNFPLSMPRMAPVPTPTAETVQVRARNVIRFGCVEGEMVINAEAAVYDPQSGHLPRPFKANNSMAERLAMVLNRGELYALSGQEPSVDLSAHVQALTDKPNAVVVKDGVRGAWVFEDGKSAGRVPAYRSTSVFKIGSGDIFTAMFAKAWLLDGMTAIEAADQASRHVAAYVETRMPIMGEAVPVKEAVPYRERAKTHKVYLAGSFFSAEHVWIIDEVRNAIDAIGIPCFSPMHDVGIGTDESFAKADIDALKECDVILALLSDMDPGTLVEIGYAVSEGIRVVAVCENPGPQDLTMVAGTGAEVFTDLATAIYHAAWAALE